MPGHVVMAEQVVFQGPLPPPDILREFKEIDEDLFREVVAMAKNSSDARVRAMDAQSVAIWVEAFLFGAGQILATIVVLFTVAAGTYAAVNGAEWAGGAIGVIGTVCTSFLKFRNNTPDKQTTKPQK